MSMEDEAKEWARKVVERNLEGIKESATFASIVSDKFLEDPYCATQMGMAIFMDKPIILVVKAGTKLPTRLERIADKVIWFDGEADLEKKKAEFHEFIKQHNL